MKHNDAAMILLVERLYEKSMRSSTPKKTAGDMYEAAEVIQQLMAERDATRKETPQYLIQMDYGEYDDQNTLPIMVVPDSVQAELVIQDLRENPNSPYRATVREVWNLDQIPADAGFSWKKLPYITIEATEEF